MIINFHFIAKLILSDGAAYALWNGRKLASNRNKVAQSGDNKNERAKRRFRNLQRIRALHSFESNSWIGLLESYGRYREPRAVPANAATRSNYVQLILLHFSAATTARSSLSTWKITLFPSLSLSLSLSLCTWSRTYLARPVTLWKSVWQASRLRGEAALRAAKIVGKLYHWVNRCKSSIRKQFVLEMFLTRS